jgi:glycosyltransferase involved in cell wall biosynthesis
MKQTVFALLGRKDEPTDAVEEYCRYLGAALLSYDLQMQVRRVPWQIHGWPDSLKALELQAASWRDTWVLVQYTALAWSSRGFPRKFPLVLKILKSAGARIAVIFHDVEPYSGSRLVDHFRRTIQLRIMRRSLSLANAAIFTVPPEKLSWLPRSPTIGHFIPVGPNLPILATPRNSRPSKDIPTVGVFTITGGEAGAGETKAIINAVRHAAQKLGKLRLSVFGRHAELREDVLREGLRDLPVEVFVEGVLSDHQVVERIRSTDVLLFVRGGISSRRGSAIAAIACGTPLVAYVGPETAWPITEAGVLLVSPQVPEELAVALVRLLSDSELRAEAALRNSISYDEHFSWSAIAARFAQHLK